MSHTDADRAHMMRALALAERGLFTTTPNPRVGCVIARGDTAIAEGFHARAGGAHAEVAALSDAASRGVDVAGATLYVTLEPCNAQGRGPPCVDAILGAGIARVLAAMPDPNPRKAGGAARLREAGVAVDVGLLEHEARELNPGFISNIERERPWVRLKVAASLDGRTALASGASQWITGEAARADGHAWRARACAILTGIGTVLNDDPAMTVRAVPTPRQPKRVIVDRHAQTPPTARVLGNEGALIVTAGECNAQWPACVESVALPDADGRVDLALMMRMLAMRNILELHVEAGARLNGALLDAGLVDEVLMYVAPSVLFDPARGAFERTRPLESLSSRVALSFHDVRRIGDDLRIVARLRSS